MNLALFLLRPLSSAGCRWVTCTLLLIRVIPGGWQLLKKDALASLALSGLPELEVLWIQNEHNAGCSGVWAPGWGPFIREAAEAAVPLQDSSGCCGVTVMDGVGAYSKN